MCSMTFYMPQLKWKKNVSIALSNYTRNSCDMTPWHHDTSDTNDTDTNDTAHWINTHKKIQQGKLFSVQLFDWDWLRLARKPCESPGRNSQQICQVLLNLKSFDRWDDMKRKCREKYKSKGAIDDKKKITNFKHLFLGCGSYETWWACRSSLDLAMVWKMNKWF